MNLRHLFFIVMPFIICGCATTSVVPHKSTNITISEEGIEAIGVGVSKIEKISNSSAIRSARYNLIDYLNVALAKVYKELGCSQLSTGNTLQNSKVIETALYNKKGNFSTVARVGISFDEIRKWIDSYYDSLPADDKLKAHSKDKFTQLMYKQLNINL